MDQALEKAYNKPAKDCSGIIGVTRKKEEAVAKGAWLNMKNNNSQIFYMIILLTTNDQYSLHHKFSQTITKFDENCVNQILDFVLQRGNPFNIDSKQVKNIVTGTSLIKDSYEFLVPCIEMKRLMMSFEHHVWTIRHYNCLILFHKRRSLKM